MVCATPCPRLPLVQSMALVDHQLLCLTTGLVQLAQLEDLEVQDLGMVVQDLDQVMVQGYLLLQVMVNLKFLYSVNSRDNLVSSSSKPRVSSSRLQQQLNNNNLLNKLHQRSDSTGKGERIYAEMLCLVIH